MICFLLCVLKMLLSVLWNFSQPYFRSVFRWIFFRFTFLNQYHLLLLNVCYSCCFVYRCNGLACSVRLVLVGLFRVTYFQLSIHATWLQDYICLCCSWDSCWLPHSCWITLGQKFILLTGCPTRCLCCYKDCCCHVVLIWPMNDPIYAIPCFLTQPVFTVKRFRMYFTSTHWGLPCQNTVLFITIYSLLTFFFRLHAAEYLYSDLVFIGAASLEKQLNWWRSSHLSVANAIIIDYYMVIVVQIVLELSYSQVVYKSYLNRVIVRSYTSRTWIELS